MSKFVLLEVIELQGEWRFATMMCGAQCVMMDGMLKMLELSVDSLDCPTHVCFELHLYTKCAIQVYIRI